MFRTWYMHTFLLLVIPLYSSHRLVWHYNVKIVIVIKWIDRYLKRFPTFEANPAPHLIRRCYQQANRVRLEIEQKEYEHNIKSIEKLILVKESNILARSINEIIRIEDLVEIEKK